MGDAKKPVKKMIKRDNVALFKPRAESNRQLLERVFSEQEPALRNFLRSRMGDGPDVDDLIQDVFAKLSKMKDLPKRVGAQRGSCRAFLCTVANNLLIDQYRYNAIRHRYQETEKEVAGVACEEIGPEQLGGGLQQLEILERAIEKLPPLWRKAFVLSRYEHMEYKEIGRELGVSAKSVQKYVHKALKNLRKAYDMQLR